MLYFTMISTKIRNYTNKYAIVEISPELPEGAARRSFHLALLIDVSGSMDGARIESVQTTLHLLIDALSEGDKLTLVKYNHTASVFASGKLIDATSRPELHTSIGALVAEGGTNIESAFSSLYLYRDTLGSPIDSVFLLTDGLITTGVSTAAGLQRVASAALPSDSLIHTLGFGCDVNARLLRDLAVRSRGSYTYADGAEVILPSIVGDIVGGLSSEVARGAAITVPEGWKCLELSAGESPQYTIGSLMNGKLQYVVFERNEGAESPSHLSLSFVSGGVPHTQGITEESAMSDADAATQIDRIRVAKAFAGVTDALESHNRNLATTLLTELHTFLDASEGKATLLGIQLRAQVDDALENLRAAIARTVAHPPLGTPVRQGFAFAPPPPPLSAMLSRLSSDTAALATQGGFFGPQPVFSSPTQQRSASQYADGYRALSQAAPSSDPVAECIGIATESSADPHADPLADPLADPAE